VTRNPNKAFERAVEVEQTSLRLHESTAARHDEIADSNSGSPLEQAARERADAARERAERVRERLRRDGVEPEG
jgi:hypothetical protein